MIHVYLHASLCISCCFSIFLYLRFFKVHHKTENSTKKKNSTFSNISTAQVSYQMKEKLFVLAMQHLVYALLSCLIRCSWDGAPTTKTLRVFSINNNYHKVKRQCS